MPCVDHQSLQGLGTALRRRDLAVDVEHHVDLARRSSLRIGGTAELWVEPQDAMALRAVLELAAGEAIDTHVVGLGSNVLFPDGELEGIVIRLAGELNGWQITEQDEDSATVEVGAGTVNAHLVRGLLESGWIGAEFLRLIPGTFGGAVALNAGTKEAELSEIVRAAEVMVPEAGNEVERRRMTPAELSLGYRRSELPDGGAVIRGWIEVERGDVEAARSAMEKDRERRDATQPYKLASAGSTFANPEDDYAGRLIDEAGLKGEAVGGARISETHANFFINEDGATAEDFLRLMALTRVRVRDQFGVDLRPEVRFVGFDGMSEIEAFERELC